MPHRNIQYGGSRNFYFEDDKEITLNGFQGAEIQKWFQFKEQEIAKKRKAKISLHMHHLQLVATIFSMILWNLWGRKSDIMLYLG